MDGALNAGRSRVIHGRVALNQGIRMSRNVFLLATAALIFLAAGSSAEERRSYSPRRLAGVPAMDGRIGDDRAWRSIPTATDFVRHGSHSPAPKQTVFRIGYTPDAVYIGVECKEPEIVRIKAVLDDMEAVWSEDSVEVFILPKGADRYFQFVMNSIGSRWSGSFTAPLTRGPGIPLADWQAAAHRGADFWSVELMIPWAVFSTRPDRGDEWQANVCRNSYLSGDGHMSWARTRGTFHEPSHFGTVVFKDAILASEGDETRWRILSAIRREVLADLALLAGTAMQLSGAAEADEDIAAFLKNCDATKVRASRIHELSIRGAEKVSRKSAMLVREGERLKGCLLLEEFFQDDRSY